MMTMPATPSMILQVLVSKSEHGWEAHCLHMDIVTEAADENSVVNDICDLIVAQLKFARDTGDLTLAFRPAPAESWQKLATARPSGKTRELCLEGRSEHVDAPTFAIQELVADAAA